MLQGASFAAVKQLREAINHFISSSGAYNTQAAPFEWRQSELKQQPFRDNVAYFCAPELECWAFHLRLRRWHFPVGLDRGRQFRSPYGKTPDRHSRTNSGADPGDWQLNFIEQIL